MEMTWVSDLRTGVRIEIASVAWMTIKTAASIGAEIAAGNVLLMAFGLDNLIELVGTGILLWRLRLESWAPLFNGPGGPRKGLHASWQLGCRSCSSTCWYPPFTD